MEPHHATPRVSSAALLALCLLVTMLPGTAFAQDPPVQPLEIYNGSKIYKYQGCFNETVDLPGTARERALPEGTHRISEGTMTAPDCLAFCGSANNGGAYKYAGIEYSR